METPLIVKKYDENYEYPPDQTCKASAIITMDKGIVTDSDKKIMDMLEGVPIEKQ